VRENAWGELAELRRYTRTRDELVEVALSKGVTPGIVEEAYQRVKVTSLAQHSGLSVGDIRWLGVRWGIVGGEEGALEGT